MTVLENATTRCNRYLCGFYAEKYTAFICEIYIQCVEDMSIQGQTVRSECYSLRCEGEKLHIARVFNGKELGFDALTEIFAAFHGSGNMLLIDFSGLHYIDRKAKELLSGMEVHKSLKSCAIVAGNMKARFLARYYIKIYRPRVPTKCFSNEQLALEWLETF